MRQNYAAPNKPARAHIVKTTLGVLLMAVALLLYVVWPRHSLQYALSLGLGYISLKLWPFGKYVCLPVAFSIFAILFSLGKNGLQPLSAVFIALAILIGLYGWREHRKSKAADKRPA